MSDTHNGIFLADENGNLKEYGNTGGGSGGGTVTADNVTYDNTSSGLSATDVQDAIDELSSNKLEYPDYTSQGIRIDSLGLTTYTCPSDGWISAKKFKINGSGSGFTINGYNPIFLSANIEIGGLFYPVKAGDVIAFDNLHGDSRVFFLANR